MEGIGQIITFYILAGIAVISAILVISLRNLVHCVISLALMMLAIAGLYITLFAEFIAMVQILIYIGAVVVLFLFLIMLTLRLTDKDIKQTNEQKGISFILAGLLLFLLVTVLNRTSWNISPEAVVENTTSKIGNLLLTTYVFPFELISVVLLACLIGAIVIARKDKD
ncbi:MAG: NADH-quinone oxidoreductase subunit J [bacterium]|nr:NADH-quinone oxidoreductase subunit J [bacterium]